MRELGQLGVVAKKHHALQKYIGTIAATHVRGAAPRAGSSGV